MAGAYAGGAGKLDGNTQAMIVSGAAADSMAGQQGVSNLQNSLNTSAQIRQASRSKSASSSATNGGATGYKNDRFTFTCPGPGGKTSTLDVPYKSQRCLAINQRYTKVMACNLVNDMRSAQANYETCSNE